MSRLALSSRRRASFGVLTAASAVVLLLGATPTNAGTFIGSRGGDTLTGTPQSDVILARDGDDDLYGAGGRDVLAAGDGRDQVLGGGGSDVLRGEGGADQVHSDDGGRDVVSCGSGMDTVFADRFDRIARDCEADGRALLHGGALATFDVVGQRFRVWVTSPATIGELRRLAAGRSLASIPAGSLRRGAGRAAHNASFSWHLDPRDTIQAEVTIELCDATPAYVEANRDEFADVVRAYCPWGARLVELRNYGGRVAPPSAGPSPGPVELPDGGSP